jgi:hypothetical protein
MPDSDRKRQHSNSIGPPQKFNGGKDKHTDLRRKTFFMQLRVPLHLEIINHGL